MKQRTAIIKTVLSPLVAAVLLTACGTNAKQAIFNPTNPSMESILASSRSSDLEFSAVAATRSEAIAHSGTLHPHQNVFRELENPTLFLYIEPHVTQSGTYIPGMTVPFKLYQQVEFALPGEL